MSWKEEIIKIINGLDDEFMLVDVYAFESKLKLMHKTNSNIKPKIRQTLQFLRNDDMIEFVASGVYRKVN